MTGRLKRLCLSFCLATGLLSQAHFAHAVPASPAISVQETFDAVTQEGSYAVTSNFDVLIFAVGNNSATSAWTTRQGWLGQTLSKAVWNTGRIFEAVPAGGTYGDAAQTLIVQDSLGGDSLASISDPTANATITVNTGDFDFDTWFPQSTVANIYFADSGQAINGSTGFEFFYSANAPASPVVAFVNGPGGVGAVPGGQAQLVPLPASWLLLLPGLLGLRARHNST